MPETKWHRISDYPPFADNNNRDAGTPVTATDDDDGDTLTYSLSGDDADSFTINEETGQLRTSRPLDFEDFEDFENDNPSYSVTVSVHDGKDASGNPDLMIDDTITVAITLTGLNEPPKPEKDGDPPDVKGNMEFTIPENSTEPMVFYLHDPEGLGEGWLISGLANEQDTEFFERSYVGPSSEQHIVFLEPPDYENPRDENEDNVYEFTLMLYDTYKDPDTGKTTATFPNVKIRVTDVEESNENPAFAEESTTRTIDENTPAGEDIGDPVEADDLDNDTLTYTLGGTDADSFDIEENTGQLQSKGELNYETKSSYEVTVSVRDGKDLENSADDETDATITVTITVDDMGEPPQFPDEADTTRTVVENTEADQDIGEPVAANDPEDDTLTYSLEGDDAAAFDIDPKSGQLKTKVELDHETKASYTIEVSVSDGKDADGNTEDTPTPDATITVTINVTDVNERPQFAEDAVSTLEIAENTADGENIGSPFTATDPDNAHTLTYSLGGDDAAAFDIDESSGQIKAKTVLDYETKDSYTVNVLVRDSKDHDGNADSATDNEIAVNISVINVDEDGSITFSSQQPQVGTALTATLTDLDGSVSGVTWSWESSPDQSTWTPISGATSESYTPVAGGEGNYLRVTASYTDAHGSGKSAHKVSDSAVLAASPNSPPSFSAETTSRSVAENTGSGQNIGTPVTATDTDTDDTLTYSLGGGDAASFDIVASSGQLQTKAALNYEAKNSYSVTVTATDTAQATNTITVTINVTNVDESPNNGNRKSNNNGGGSDYTPPANSPPYFRDGDTTERSVAEKSEKGTNIGGPVTAGDPDGNKLTYTLGGDDANSFSIDADAGQLKTEIDLDFEVKSTYSVSRVRVRQAGRQRLHRSGD